MQIDLTLADTDREIEYDVTVNACVVAEIGGAPGYCVDIDSVQVNEIVVYFNHYPVALDAERLKRIDADRRKFIERYVERTFEEEITKHCIEHFEGRRLEEPVRDASVERGLRALADSRPELADKCRTILLAGQQPGGPHGS